MAKSTVGTDLMRQMNEGRAEQLPSAVLAKTREKITDSIEMLIDAGVPEDEPRDLLAVQYACKLGLQLIGLGIFEPV